MKVCYIFRPKERNVFSIENVFNTIAEHIIYYGIEPSAYFCNISFWKQVKELRNIKADVYHITGDVHYLALFLPRKKTTITIHDIGHFKNSKRSPKFYLYALLWFILPIWWVRKITAISIATKNDLIHYFKINPDKIAVIADPLSIPIIKSPKGINVKNPVIMQHARSRYKNLYGLIHAIKDFPCRLEIIGKPHQDLIDEMDKLKINYHYEYNITAERLIQKYNECDILFFASLSEGFGLPILEAQAVGRPVITSNIQPMKDIAGNGAILVDPKSVEEIHNAFVYLQNIGTDNLNLLIERGFTNVQKYMPDKIAKAYSEFYLTNF